MKGLQTIIGLAAAIICGVVMHAQAQSPKGKYANVALTNATIETVTKGTIQNGTVLIVDGKIAGVGTSVSIPAGTEIIDCKGKFIYPGMIDAGTNLGLNEISAVARTTDFNEIGEVIPQMKALSAVNPNASAIPVTRVSGVTTALTIPTGGMLSGTAALINLHGYTPDQMYAGFEGIVLNFPNTGRRGFFDRRSDDAVTGAITNYDELQFAANTTPTFIQDYISRYYAAEEANLMSRSYAKLREVTISYNLPKSVLTRTFLKSATVSLVGRNLLYFAEKSDMDIDQFTAPDGYASLQSPSLRRYGVNINLTF
jgi:hypothetical protein